MMILAVGREVCLASGGVGSGVDRNPRHPTSRASDIPSQPNKC